MTDVQQALTIFDPFRKAEMLRALVVAAGGELRVPLNIAATVRGFNLQATIEGQALVLKAVPRDAEKPAA